MNDNGKLLTIAEASTFAGVSISALYKKIRKGTIHVQYDIVQGKKIKKVVKAEIARIFPIKEKEVLYGTIPDITRYNTGYNTEYNAELQNKTQTEQENSSMYNTGYNTGYNTELHSIIREDIKKVIEDYFEHKQTQLMRPLEEQAIFIAGELKNEVKHLKAEKEILQQENETLREAIKALPGPVEEINAKLQQQQIIITTFEKEKQIWQNEKEEQIQKLDEQRKELEVQQEQAMKEQEARLKTDAEEQMKQLSEAWKKELEQAHRPWWKFW